MAGRRHATASSVHPPVMLIVSKVSAAPTYLASQLQSSRRAPGLIYACGDLATLAGGSANHIYGYFYIVFARIVSFKETRRQCSRAQPVTGTSPDSRGLRTPHAASTAPPKVKPYANS